MTICTTSSAHLIKHIAPRCCDPSSISRPSSAPYADTLYAVLCWTQVMAVSVRGKVYKLRVRSGPEGKEDFKRQIRQLLGFTQDMDFDVIFE